MPFVPAWANTDMVTAEGALLDDVARILGITREAALQEKVLPASLGRGLIEPQEIADMVVYLASDSGEGMTGQAINACGGAAS